jgi:hypothetical protein
VLRFHVDASDSDIVRGVARWRYHPGRRYHDGAIDLPLTVAAGIAGSVRVVVTPPHAGPYYYDVEVEDAAGRRSNVLREHVSVELRPIWSRRVPCEAPTDETTS